MHSPYYQGSFPYNPRFPGQRQNLDYSHSYNPMLYSNPSLFNGSQSNMARNYDGQGSSELDTMIYNTFNSLKNPNVRMVILQIQTPKGYFHIPVFKNQTSDNVKNIIRKHCREQVTGYNVQHITDPRTLEVIFSKPERLC